MKTRYYRPPYFLLHNADAAGCGYHRIIRPLEIMSRAGVAAGRHDMRVWMNEEIAALQPDVVVWQRQHEDSQIENMQRYKQMLPNAFMVYEIDDALSLVPEWSYHKPFLPADVDQRMARALAHCDVISVSTRELGRHMRSVCGNAEIEIRVVPNMLGADDFDTCDIISSKTRQPRIRPRVGWYGGISHHGDLALIAKAVDATASDVDWVFFGMKPDCKAPVEFHEGVSPRDYLAKLASLDLDVIVAPIEDNQFNRCKSNLRLIESGACGYPVIASHVTPYMENNPPIDYAQPNDWADAVMAFVSQDLDERRQIGERLRAWARRHYCLEDNKLEERIKKWLPRGAKPFLSSAKSGVRENGLVVVAPEPIDELMPFSRYAKTFDDARDMGGDILYVRWNCTVDKAMVDRLRGRLVNPNVAAVTPMTNDGGPGGFPRPMVFQNVDIETGAKIEKVCAELFSARNESVVAPCGPVILISRRALDWCGYFESGLAPEAAIIEWAIMAGSRGLNSVVAADCFTVSLAPHIVPGSDQLAQRAMMRWPVKQLPPDPLADVRRDIEIAFHKEYYKTPLPVQQPSYSEWAAIFDTPGERDRALIRGEAEVWENPPLFELCILPSVGGETHIEHDEYLKVHPASAGGATWVLFVREGAMVAPHATYMIARAIRDNPGAAVIYGDHDILTPDAVRADNDFKPLLFDLELFLGRDYVSPICAVRRDLLPPVLGIKAEEELYWYLLTLARDRVSDFVHVPRVLAHLQISNPEREFRMRQARVDAINRVFAGSAQAKPHPLFIGYTQTFWDVADPAPKVSIIIPTKNKVEMISPCISTLLKITDYPNYEVIVVDNGSTHQGTLDYLAGITDPRVRVIQHDVAFNWSEINNYAAREHAKGSLLLFLNDDTRVIESHWLRAMVGHAQRADVGIVGARLLYPMGAVQHCGVICTNGLAGHIHKGLPSGLPGYQGIAALNHEATAVTGACMLVRRDLFEAMGGFDERFAHNFNDVAFCLKAADMGYRCVVAGTAQLQHLEGVSRGPAGPLMRQEAKLLGQLFPRVDRYWNRNLTFQHTVDGMQVTGVNMEMLRWPMDKWPWRDDNWPAQRYLFLGDDGLQAIKEAREGHAVFRLDINGLSGFIGHPFLQNVPPWDIRNVATAKDMLAKLGIDKIIVCNLPEGAERALGFITKLDIPVEYRPGTAEAICPFRNFTPNGAGCDGGWARGECQACVDKHGSPFGYVNMRGWKLNWGAFLHHVNVNYSRMPPKYLEALEKTFP